MATAQIQTLTTDNFDEAIAQDGLPYMVKFWAPWCGYCQTMAPIVEEIAAEHTDVLTVGEVNIDDEPGLAEKYKASTIPTFVVFRNGREAKRVVGAKSKEVLADELARFL